MFARSSKKNIYIIKSNQREKQGVAGHMFRTEPVIAENRFTKITIGDNQK